MTGITPSKIRNYPPSLRSTPHTFSTEADVGDVKANYCPATHFFSFEKRGESHWELSTSRTFLRGNEAQVRAGPGHSHREGPQLLMCPCHSQLVRLWTRRETAEKTHSQKRADD